MILEYLDPSENTIILLSDKEFSLDMPQFFKMFSYGNIPITLARKVGLSLLF